MTYARPRNDSMVDIYCCRNPYCKKRILKVTAVSPAPVHCGITAFFLATWPLATWLERCLEVKHKVRDIKARIEADKIRRERAA